MHWNEMLYFWWDYLFFQWARKKYSMGREAGGRGEGSGGKGGGKRGVGMLLSTPTLLGQYLCHNEPVSHEWHLSIKILGKISGSCNIGRWSTYELWHDKTNKMSVRPAKTQISLGIRPVWSESPLSAWRTLRSLATHWVHSDNSDQTGRMPRLIRVFAGCTVTLFVLSCRASYIFGVNVSVTLNQCPKNNIHPSNSHQDIGQSQWTTKYMSLTHIYFMWSAYVSKWSPSSSLLDTCIRQNHWTAKCRSLSEVNLCQTEQISQIVWHDSIK